MAVQILSTQNGDIMDISIGGQDRKSKGERDSAG